MEDRRTVAISGVTYNIMKDVAKHPRETADDIILRALLNLANTSHIESDDIRRVNDNRKDTK